MHMYKLAMSKDKVFLQHGELACVEQNRAKPDKRTIIFIHHCLLCILLASNGEATYPRPLQLDECAVSWIETIVLKVLCV
jgi:hypothetical protein